MEKTFEELINDYIVAGAENNKLRRMKKQDSIKKQWIKKRAKASNPPEPIYVKRGTFRKRIIVNPILESAFQRNLQRVRIRNKEDLDNRILEGKKEMLREEQFKNRIMEQERAGEQGYVAALEHAKIKQYKDAGKDYVKLYQQKRHKMGRPIKGQHAYRISRAANKTLKNKPSPLRNVSEKIRGGKRKSRRARKTRKKKNKKKHLKHYKKKPRTRKIHKKRKTKRRKRKPKRKTRKFKQHGGQLHDRLKNMLLPKRTFTDDELFGEEKEWEGDYDPGEFDYYADDYEDSANDKFRDYYNFYMEGGEFHQKLLALSNKFPSELIEEILSFDGNYFKLDLENTEITDISPLSKLTNLTYLNLGDNKITDVSPLSKLTNLTNLRLGSNHITNISPLSNLSNLTSLNLKYNKITDIKPLRSLTNLTYLNLYKNQIEDISPLSGLTNLIELYLEKNKINDIQSLSNLTILTHLYLDDNRIEDISSLSKLTNLIYLSLSRNRIEYISPLSGLTNLTDLSLGSNHITDVSPLSGLTNLTALYFDEYEIRDKSPLKHLKLRASKYPGIWRRLSGVPETTST